MRYKGRFGKTELAPVSLLAAMGFDLSDGVSLPATLGKTTIPEVVLHPAMAYDLRPAESLPALQVTVQVRAGAAPAQVGADLFRLCLAVHRLDLSLAGSGVTPDENATASDGACQLTFRPTRLEGSLERFSRMANLINGAAALWLPEPIASVERCEARLLAA